MNSKLIFLVAIVILLAGCATAPHIERPATAGQEQQALSLANNIRVGEVAGGGRNSNLQMVILDRKDFRQALMKSLAAAGFLADDSSAGYVLKATIVEVGQPPSGRDMTVTCVIEYSLVWVADGKELANQRMTTSSTSGLDESHALGERAEAAKEGAASSNIALLLKKLEELKSGQEQVSAPR